MIEQYIDVVHGIPLQAHSSIWQIIDGQQSLHRSNPGYVAQAGMYAQRHSGRFWDAKYSQTTRLRTSRG